MLANSTEDMNGLLADDSNANPPKQQLKSLSKLHPGKTNHAVKPDEHCCVQLDDVPRRARSKSIVVSFIHDDCANNNDQEEKSQQRLRRISTPEMLSRQKIQNRKSLESLEQLKAIRARNKSMLLDPNMYLANNVTSFKYEPEPTRPPTKTSSPSLRNRALSNIFRKISTSSKNLNRRSVLLSRNFSEIDITSNASTDNGTTSQEHSTVDDMVNVMMMERDRAIEEWTETAKKCEELIDELEQTLTELIAVRSDRDHKQSEIQRLLHFYDHDLDDRDNEIELLQTQVIEMHEKLMVCRAERTEAYDERDGLLQQTYLQAQSMEECAAQLSNVENENKELKQKCQMLENQVVELKKNHASALELWNTTVEEREQLHNNHISLAQTRDDSMRKTSSHQEEIALLKSELNRLRAQLEHIQRNDEENATEETLADASTPHGSSFLTSEPQSISKAASSTIKEMATTAENQRDNIISEHIEEEDDDIDLEEEDEENEDIAICIDTFDSRTGLKLDNAFDMPRVIVSDVTSELEEKWSIKKHDRIISVNGVAVQNADKKVVERLIKETVGRTISLVLRREKLMLKNKDFSDVEIVLGKQQQDIGLYYKLIVEGVDGECCADGVQSICVGDTITKINSQDINSMIDMLLKKLAKKSNNRLTLRVRKVNETGTNSFSQLRKKQQDVKRQQTRNFYGLQRKKSSALSTDSARNVFSDISSLFSFSSIYQTGKTNNTDDTSITSKPCNATRSVSPRPMKLSKQKAIESIPTIYIDEHMGGDELHSSTHKQRLYSPVRSNSFESFTQVHSCHLYDDNNTRDAGQNLEVTITPPKRNSLHRPSPRLRGIDDLVERRSPKVKSLYLEALNRHSFAISEAESAIDARLKRSSVVSSPSSISLRSIVGYATIPRYKRNKSKEKLASTVRTVRINKTDEEPLGFRICGGNRIGIFVSGVAKHSAAEIAGLQVGDKIAQLNSIDLTKVTLHYATKVLLNNRKCLKIRLQIEEHDEYVDILDTSRMESLYVKCLHAYHAVNLNEMSFKAGDILHVTNTRYNFDEINMKWTWYGIKKVSASKQCEGEIPAIEMFTDKKETIIDSQAAEKRKSFRKINKSAQDVKNWFKRTPSFRKKKTTHKLQADQFHSNKDKPEQCYYEILLEEPTTRV